MPFTREELVSKIETNDTEDIGEGFTHYFLGRKPRQHRSRVFLFLTCSERGRPQDCREGVPNPPLTEGHLSVCITLYLC